MKNHKEEIVKVRPLCKEEVLRNATRNEREEKTMNRLWREETGPEYESLSQYATGEKIIVLVAELEFINLLYQQRNSRGHRAKRMNWA